MRFMALIKSDAAAEAGEMPDAQFMTAMGKYNEDLINAGVMLSGEGLQASAKGARVRITDNDAAVENGPFSDPTSLVAGFWIWQADSLDDAIAWAKRCPTPAGVPVQLEVRQIFEMSDFA